MSEQITLGETMIAAIARSIDDRSSAFHGFGSPLVQLALHVAKRTHAPDLVLVAGATYGINPNPPFLAPTGKDSGFRWLRSVRSCQRGIADARPTAQVAQRTAGS